MSRIWIKEVNLCRADLATIATIAAIVRAGRAADENLATVIGRKIAVIFEAGSHLRQIAGFRGCTLLIRIDIPASVESTGRFTSLSA
jgi:hypothetical protein